MTDGVKLATDVYLPAGNGPFPVLLQRTPYGRVTRAMAGVTRQGYAMVVQDMRGRFDSEGENLPFVGCGWADHRDGAETIAWIRKQPWCNGKTGTLGGSAQGITQNLMAGAAPEGLTAQFIRFAAGNLYTQAAYVGGALRKEQLEGWTAAHQFDPKVMRLWRAHPCFDDYWLKFDTARKFPVMNVPAVHVGGWFDTFSQGTIDEFLGRQTRGAEGGKGRQKLVMGPWVHGASRRGPQGELTFPNSDFPAAYSELRWFACLLKDANNGVLDEPAVAYYVMGDTSDPEAPGNQWRYADAWPIPCVETPYYFVKGGRLTTTRPGSREPQYEEYTFDPAVPCPTIGGRNLEIRNGPMDQRSVEGRKDVVTFTTEALEEPVEVTGRIKAKVFVSSSAADTDLSVRLCDVYGDGKSYLMAEGMLRLRYRDSLARVTPLTPGKVYEVTVDCWSTSVVINRGHRIRVAVTSSNYPRFDLNPGTGRTWTDGGEFVKQVNRIYCDGRNSSAIILPVLRAGPAASQPGRPERTTRTRKVVVDSP